MSPAVQRRMHSGTWRWSDIALWRVLHRCSTGEHNVDEVTRWCVRHVQPTAGDWNRFGVQLRSVLEVAVHPERRRLRDRGLLVERHPPILWVHSEKLEKKSYATVDLFTCAVFVYSTEWRKRLGNFGGMGWRKRKRILRDRNHPMGSRGEDPIGGLEDEHSLRLIWAEIGR